MVGAIIDRLAVDGYKFALRFGEYETFYCAGGSDLSAAGGRRSEGSEWQRSTDAKALRRRRQMSGTATEPVIAPTV